MIVQIPNIWKAVGVLCAAGVPGSLVLESGMPYIEKYGIAGMLMFGVAFCYGQWVMADKARAKEHAARLAEMKANADRIDAMHQATITRLQTELTLEKQRTAPRDS